VTASPEEEQTKQSPGRADERTSELASEQSAELMSEQQAKPLRERRPRQAAAQRAGQATERRPRPPGILAIGPVERAILTIRSAVFWVWQIIVTLVLGGPVIIGSLISFNIGMPLALTWIRANMYGLRVICGVRWEVDGEENIPAKPCVVMSKHQSTWETYFLAMLFVPPVYVAKRSLLWIPIFGWAIGALRFIMIDRKSGRSAVAQMVEQARDRLERKCWVVIFPEGTRQAVDAVPNYRIGGAIVAARTGYDILPIATNSGEFWPRLGFIKYPGTITVSIRPPIKADGREPAALLAATQASIEARMAEIRGKGPGARP